MKGFIKNVFYLFLFTTTFFMVSCLNASAKSSSSPAFEVEVGSEKLPVYYSLEQDGTEVKEQIQFVVNLKGLEKTGKSYRWEHSLCYKILGQQEVCEIDYTGLDQENPKAVYSDESYTYYFYDGDMPYYSEALEFEYVKFNNKFVEIKDESNSFVLDEISFDSNEIDYNYYFDIETDYYENNGKKYINYLSAGTGDEKVYIRGYLNNNIGSSIKKEDAPVFTLTNQICVGENICDEVTIDLVNDSQGNELNMTPYMGNLTFYYMNEILKYDENGVPEYSFAKYKSTLTCVENCNSRIPSSKVLLDETFYFDTEKPYLDTENTVISSVNEYVKSVKIKIAIKDDESGLEESSFKYRLGWNNNGKCSFTSEVFYYENGVEFEIGENLKDGAMCMYYTAADKIGNSFKSDTYYFYFDNNGPTISADVSGYDEGYYNSVSIPVLFLDNHSGVKEIYYLWSASIVSEEEYEAIKENGNIYDNNGVFSSIYGVGLQGTYYLHFLAYDSLGNYKYYSLGSFNFDRVPLVKNDVVVTAVNTDEYNAQPYIKLKVNDAPDGVEFKCGFFVKGQQVAIDMLDVSCYNNVNIELPMYLENEYSLWVYAYDKANNFSLLEVKEGLFIDTKAPIISCDILKEEDNYYLTNEITLSVTDLNTITLNSLKYGWFLKDKENVTSSDLDNTYVNNETIGYPKNLYGEYVLYLNAADVFGNERLIKVDKIFKIDTDVIRISLVGSDSITIIRGQKYIDEGAKAYKGSVSSGGRVSDIKVSGEINTNVAGVYYITYSSGEGDLLVSVTRKIVIKSDVPYIIFSGIIFAVGALFLSLRLFGVNKKKGDK